MEIHAEKIVDGNALVFSEKTKPLAKTTPQIQGLDFRPSNLANQR